MNTKDIIAELQSIIDSSRGDSMDDLTEIQTILTNVEYEPESRESMMTTYVSMSKHCNELLEELNLLRIQMLALETMISDEA